MDRRTYLQLTGSTALLALALPGSLLTQSIKSETAGTYLFFHPSDLKRIRDNCTSGFLSTSYRNWVNFDYENTTEEVKKVLQTGNLLTDFPVTLRTMQKSALAYLVERDSEMRKLTELCIDTALQLPKWDYFLEGGTQVFGLQRAPLANLSILFAMEVLRDELPEAKSDEIRKNIAEKGCLPCYRALWGMEHPNQVEGWSMDKQHRSRYEIDMSRWPEILDKTNLKAVPVMGLGLGALALEGHDDRSEEWLDLAAHSAREVLNMLTEDGSYHEGISYADYTFRSLFLFFEAHYQNRGDIDWLDLANFTGLTEYLVTMQMGIREPGIPDIANFSDAKNSFHKGTAFWLANRTGDPLAQFAAKQYSYRTHLGDFLWYRKENPTSSPPVSLKNKKNDLDWILCRTGWESDDAMIAFRSGEPANHEHADRNSFIYKYKGERLLTDHFGAAYDWRQEGWILRLTGAHNAILIDGEGHQYHEGSEGTNASRSRAEVIRLVDRGDTVWWCSDATQAYRLVNPDVQTVRRTLLFMKPDLIVLFDQVKKATQPSRIAARFHPDNRDDQAKISTETGSFTIVRPNARLFGTVRASSPLSVTSGKMDLPEEKGQFPFIETESAPSKECSLVTALNARATEMKGDAPEVDIRFEKNIWIVQTSGKSISIHPTGEIPEIEWRST